MFSKLKVLPNIYLQLLERSKIKIRSKIIYSEDFSAHDLRWETSYFEVAAPGHTLLRKTLIIY